MHFLWAVMQTMALELQLALRAEGMCLHMQSPESRLQGTVMQQVWMAAQGSECLTNAQVMPQVGPENHALGNPDARLGLQVFISTRRLAGGEESAKCLLALGWG